MNIDTNRLMPGLAYSFTRPTLGPDPLTLEAKLIYPIAVFYPKTGIADQEQMDDALTYIARTFTDPEGDAQNGPSHA